jgi:hypothetical protein
LHLVDIVLTNGDLVVVFLAVVGDILVLVLLAFLGNDLSKLLLSLLLLLKVILLGGSLHGHTRVDLGEK